MVAGLLGATFSVQTSRRFGIQAPTDLMPGSTGPTDCNKPCNPVHTAAGPVCAKRPQTLLPNYAKTHARCGRTWLSGYTMPALNASLDTEAPATTILQALLLEVQDIFKIT